MANPETDEEGIARRGHSRQLGVAMQHAQAALGSIKDAGYQVDVESTSPPAVNAIANYLDRARHHARDLLTALDGFPTHDPRALTPEEPTR